MDGWRMSSVWTVVGSLREAALFSGDAGWGEWSPFLEYGPEEAARWLRAALEDADLERPPAVRQRVPVNATLPAVAPQAVADVLARYDGCFVNSLLHCKICAHTIQHCLCCAAIKAVQFGQCVGCGANPCVETLGQLFHRALVRGIALGVLQPY